VETFYNMLHQRIKLHEESIENEASVECDELGQLIPLFEKDKFPMPETFSEHYIRVEILQKEIEAKLLAEKKALAEKVSLLCVSYCSLVIAYCL
jgi:hypothetical protein